MRRPKRKFGFLMLAIVIAPVIAMTVYHLVFVLMAYLEICCFDTLKGWSYCQISGDSMFPALKGEARALECPRCGYFGLCSLTQTPVCANCRWLMPKAEGRLTMPEYVQLENSPPPQRWDKVVFTRGGENDRLVKRVWGLPGEDVEIRGGKVYVDGRRPPRPLEVLEEMRILVNNDHYRPGKRGEGSVSRWTADGNWENPQSTHWRCTHPDNPSRDVDSFLLYIHQESRVTVIDETVGPVVHYFRIPITNQRSINGTQMRSEWIHAVDELMLCFTLRKLEGHGAMEVTLPVGEQRAISFFFGATDIAFIPFKERSGRFFIIPADKIGESCQVTVTTFDGVPRLWINGRPWEETRVNTNSAPAEYPESMQNSPLVGFSGPGEVEISSLVVYRDEYFLKKSAQFAYSAQKSLENTSRNGYYLMGDNSLISEDSRQFGRVPETDILGRVRYVIHPADKFDY